MSKEKDIETKVPLHRPGFAVSDANLTAEEGYVWSRIDGVSTVDQLCLMTGLGREKTLEIIRRLQEQEVIEMPGRGGSKTSFSGCDSAASKGTSARSSLTTSPNKSPAAENNRPGSQNRPLPAGREENKDNEVGITEEQRNEIEEYYARLDALSFYHALGINRDAGNKEILRAYKKKSLQFHPDRHYGKILGRYKGMLEEIFKYITQVKDFLLDPEKRRKYDETLAENAEIKRQAEDAHREEEEELKSGEDLREIAARLESEVGRDRSDGKGTTDKKAAQDVSRLSVRERAGRYTRKKSRLRIQALANQLGEFGGRAETQQHSSSGGASTRSGRTATASSLSAVLGKAVDERKGKGKNHYEEGVRKLLDGNFIGASTSLKLATVFDPENEEYKKKYEVAAARAGELIAEQQYKQARFHLSVGRWEPAARLLVQAADHHPIALYEMEAAEALMKTGELRRAQQYAIKSVESAPENVQARVVLASVYKDAGMYRNARREIEIALKLDPDNSEARGLSREIRKCV